MRLDFWLTFGYILRMQIHTPAELKAMSPRDYKVLDNKLRRMVQRRGYQLSKSRVRDPWAIGYGVYWIINPKNNSIEAGDPQNGMTLSEVERWLATHRPRL